MTEHPHSWREEFLALVERDDPPPLETALALSRLLQRGALWPQWSTRLAELESGALRRCGAPGSTDAGEAAAALMALLREEGFTGNTEDYEAVDNSFIDRVLELQRGLPITLSLLAIHLGRTAGIPIVGIGFPGHFIVGVDLEGQTPSIFDPFNGGQRLSFHDLAALYQAATGKIMTAHAPLLRQSLEPAPTAEILSRMLRNLHHHYRQRGSHDRVAEVVGLLAVLHPDVDRFRQLQGKVTRRLATLN